MLRESRARFFQTLLRLSEYKPEIFGRPRTRRERKFQVNTSTFPPPESRDEAACHPFAALLPAARPSSWQRAVTTEIKRRLKRFAAAVTSSRGTRSESSPPRCVLGEQHSARPRAAAFHRAGALRSSPRASEHHPEGAGPAARRHPRLLRLPRSGRAGARRPGELFAAGSFRRLSPLGLRNGPDAAAVRQRLAPTEEQKTAAPY